MPISSSAIRKILAVDPALHQADPGLIKTVMDTWGSIAQELLDYREGRIMFDHVPEQAVAVDLEESPFPPDEFIEHAGERWLLNGMRCTVCGQLQFDTPHGELCTNGHGGAPGVPKDQTFTVTYKGDFFAFNMPGES